MPIFDGPDKPRVASLKGPGKILQLKQQAQRRRVGLFTPTSARQAQRGWSAPSAVLTCVFFLFLSIAVP
jgi:hypothetical protein